MAKQNSFETLAVRNQALIEGLKMGQHKKFEPYLRRLDKRINAAVLGAGTILETKKRAKELERKINEIQNDIYADYLSRYSKDLVKIGTQQAAFEAGSYEVLAVSFKSQVPTTAQVITAYMVNPLQVEGYAGNPLLDSYLKDVSNKEIKRVNKAVSDGFSQGLTNQQIATNIRGTKANRFNDGILAISNRSNASMVRTSVQHVSTQARMESMRKNSDVIKGYKIVVTFDDRTTTLCYDIGQQDITYPIGKGPMPPLHVGCRDAIEPVVSSEFDFLDEGATRPAKGADGASVVSTKLGSYDWMLTQPVKFQEAAMGVTRSKLLRDGGITPTEFAKLSTNKRFQTLTLDQMRAKAPSVFERAGL